jgi:hypothetical protein
LLTFAEVILTNNLSFVNAIIMPKYEAPPAAKGGGFPRLAMDVRQRVSSKNAAFQSKMNAHPYTEVFNLYLHKARPVDLAEAYPGKKQHLKSIAHGLRAIRRDISYASMALSDYFLDEERYYSQNCVSQKLSSATVLLEGLLDALVICALPDDTRPKQNMNFRCKNAFYDPRLGEIQNSVKALQTFSTSNRVSYADLWTLADFWKHYLPCMPLPKEFPVSRVDFQIELGLNSSGPILHDIILPSFNYACDMVAIIGQQLKMNHDDWAITKL